MQLMTLEEMLFYKKISGLSCTEIAEKSGVPLSTVQKVFSQTTNTPRNKTLLQLAKAFEEFQNEKLYLCEPFYEKQIMDSINKKRKGKVSKTVTSIGSNALDLSSYENKTIDDYLALPGDVKVELIDGVFYDMAAPSYLHTQIASLIWKSLDDYIYSNKGKCSATMAPTDVQLDSDDKTMVQPDVLVTCDRDKIISDRVVGAPDFIVEVMSESNWYNDVFMKRAKYEQAGVREYWIVMPKHKKIQVYFFEKSASPIEYTFDDVVPVNIWDGKCKVDFKEICKRLDFLME